MALLSPRDARRWNALARRLAPAIEVRLKRGVIADRPANTGRRLVDVLGAARRAAAALSMRSPLLIKADVRSFYPSVTPRAAFDSVATLTGDRHVARRAAEMLDGWGSEGYAGLPIGPKGSPVVANAVLCGVDHSLGAVHLLRWIDDYLIGVENPRAARETLERLDESLALRGLEKSEAKTVVLEGRRPFRWLGTSG